MSELSNELDAISRELDSLELSQRRRRAVRLSTQRYNRKYARKYKKGRIICPDWSHVGK